MIQFLIFHFLLVELFVCHRGGACQPSKSADIVVLEFVDLECVGARTSIPGGVVQQLDQNFRILVVAEFDSC